MTFMPKKDRRALDEMIFLKRVIEIDKYREENGLPTVQHTGNVNKDIAEKTLEKYRQDLGEKKYKDFEKRVNNFFDVYKKLLKDKYDAGLISKASYDAISPLDYAPRKLIAAMTDYNGDISEAGKRRTTEDMGNLSESQVKSLNEGSVEAFVKNAEWLLSSSLKAGYRAIATNKMTNMLVREIENQKAKFKDIGKKIKNGEKVSKKDREGYDAYKEIKDKIILNPVVGIKDGKPVFKITKTPENFQKAYYWKDGVRYEAFMENEMHQQYFNNVNGIFTSDSNAKQITSWLSGTAVLKFFATGNNPFFFMVNVPRDAAFTYVFTDTYSPILPIGIVQMSVETVKAINDLRKYHFKIPGNLTEKLIENGLSMEFLSTQGRVKGGSIIGRAYDYVMPKTVKEMMNGLFGTFTMSKFQTYSELVFRVGLAQKEIGKMLKDFDVKNIDDITDQKAQNRGYENKQDAIDDIYQTATAAARGVLDFNQGGSLVKDADAVIPYANVAVQGTRRMVEEFHANPLTTTAKMLQSLSLISGTAIGVPLMLISRMRDEEDEEDKDLTNAEIYFKTMEGLSVYERVNYISIPTGVRNEKGDYEAYRIAKEHTLTPFLVYSDWMAQNFLRKVNGIEEESSEKMLSRMKFAFANNLTPVEIGKAPVDMLTASPTARAILTYETGYDFFREQPLVNQGYRKISKNTEGLSNPNVEQFYKEMGKDYDISPIRTKAAVESFLTSPQTNPLVGVIYTGAGTIWEDDKILSTVHKDLYDNVMKSPLKRLKTKSSEFIRTLEQKKSEEKMIEKELERAERHRVKENDIIFSFQRGEITAEEFLKKSVEMNPENPEKLIEKSQDMADRKSIDRNILDLKYAQSVRIRALMTIERYGNILEGTPENIKIISEMERAGGIWTESFQSELFKILLEKGN